MEVYGWIESIHGQKTTKNITRDYSDGLAVAEIVKHYFPKYVDMHNYPPANGPSQKLYNWKTLRQKPFRKLNYAPSDEVLEAISHCKPGFVELLLCDLKQKIEQRLDKERGRGNQYRDYEYEEQGQTRHTPQFVHQQPHQFNSYQSIRLPPIPFQQQNMDIKQLQNTYTNQPQYQQQPSPRQGQMRMIKQYSGFHQPVPEQQPHNRHTPNNSLMSNRNNYTNEPFNRQSSQLLNNPALKNFHSQQSNRSQPSPQRPSAHMSYNNSGVRSENSDLCETIRLLQLKVSKLEQLIEIKDRKLSEFQRIQQSVMEPEKEIKFPIGKTRSGVVFKVPQTHDLVQNLFSFTSKKTILESAVLVIMFIEIFMFLFVPSLPREFFLGLFVFWRLSYNVGLGILLRSQSENQQIVKYCRKLGLDRNDKSEKNAVVKFLMQHVSMKLAPDFKYNDVPIEFTSWLVFRGLVDMILLNDFTCYFLFSCSYFVYPETITLFDILRWVGGCVLITFNLWVKIDAHRVVKDFAWYWGDFFYLIEASLTFDGVFEMAPHPMYSVGYIGFYGSALISQSYMVLFASLLAHAAQFAFLYIVENPHIEKTYNLMGPQDKDDSREILQLYFRRDLIVFKNFDWFRSSDLFSVLIAAYSFVTAFIVGSIDANWKLYFYIGQALFWRILHTYGMGTILHLQSKNKTWTKHFIKYGEGPREAFAHWKIIYNLTLCITYVSYSILAFRVYSFPSEWTYGTILLKHTLGILLILLHLWTSVSIYEVLGDFGWFYGDFFIDELKTKRGLFYTGIYRFLNNPEKIIGHAFFWGMALICNSPLLFTLSLFGQLSTWLFLHYVEAPHMRNLYGSQVRPKAGAFKVVGKVGTDAVNSVVRKFELGGVIDKVKDIIPSSRFLNNPALSSGALKTLTRQWEEDENPNDRVDVNLFPETSEFEVRSDNPSECDSETDLIIEKPTLRKKRARDVKSFSEAMKITGQIMEELLEEVEKAVDTAFPTIQILLEKVLTARKDDKTLSKIPTHLYKLYLEEKTVPLGDPLRIEFTVPLAYMSTRDWIGVYPVKANPRKNITFAKSKGRWSYINGTQLRLNDSSDGLDSSVTIPSENSQSGTIGTLPVQITESATEKLATGQITFSGIQVPWKSGIYEARYHYYNKYSVLCISEPFEIRAGIVKSKQSVQSISDTLKRHCGNIVAQHKNAVDLAGHDDIFDIFVKNAPLMDTKTFKTKKKIIAEIIVGLIFELYRVEFTWSVVEHCRTVDALAEKVHEASIHLMQY